jgi:hypothetical protein
LSVLDFIHLPTHQPRMGSASDCKSLRSGTELKIRKMLISSANKKCLERYIELQRQLINTLNSRDQRTDPWVTPESTSKGVE